MMLRVTKPLSRFAVALGGFLIFIGIIVMGFCVIGFLDPSILESENLQNFQSLPLLLLLTIGLLDLVAGIILRRRWLRMKIRRILTAIIGIAQEVIGILSGVLSAMLFFNILEVQTIFNLPSELLLLYLLILGLFSLFSVISGFFLIREGRR